MILEVQVSSTYLYIHFLNSRTGIWVDNNISLKYFGESFQRALVAGGESTFLFRILERMVTLNLATQGEFCELAVHSM